MLAAIARAVGCNNGEVIAGLGFKVRVLEQRDGARDGVDAENLRIANRGEAVGNWTAADITVVGTCGGVHKLIRTRVLIDWLCCCTGGDGGRNLIQVGNDKVHGLLAAVAVGICGDNGKAEA